MQIFLGVNRVRYGQCGSGELNIHQCERKDQIEKYQK